MPVKGMPKGKAMSGMKRMVNDSTDKKAKAAPGKSPKKTSAGLQKVMAAAKSARKSSTKR